MELRIAIASIQQDLDRLKLGSVNGLFMVRPIQVVMEYLKGDRIAPLPRMFNGKYLGRDVFGIEMPNGKRIWGIEERLTGCCYDYPDERSANLEITEWINGAADA